MKRVNRTVYEADDGKVFEDEVSCTTYEAQIREREKRTTYWRVTHKPDLTEGRGHYGCTFLEVYGPEWAQQDLVEDYCFRTYGRPVAFVMGVSPMRNWYLGKLTRDQFIKEMPEGRVGDYSHKGERVQLVMGEGEKGLIVKGSA